MIEVIEYSVELIDPSPFQARRRFDEEALRELGESVREHGVLSPLLVRLSPHDPARLELVNGERRLRAARAVGRQTVPVIVRELDDVAAEEIQLIENLQREDLTPREEAEGYHRALALESEGKKCHTLMSLAKKIGKPLNHVRNRLRLLRCPVRLLDALERDEVAVSTAMLIGGVPDEKAREEITKRVLTPEIQEIPLNFVQTRQLIQEQYMMSLKGVSFDREAAELVPAVYDEAGMRCYGGSCVDCPFRTGNDPDVQGEIAAGVNADGKGGSTRGVSPWLCTLPTCWRAKQDAAWKIARTLLTEQGLKVIEGDDARRLFRGPGGTMIIDSDYVDLSVRPEGYEFGPNYVAPTGSWKQMLKGLGVPVVVARHPMTCRRIELAEKKLAVAAIKRQLDKQTEEQERQEAIATAAAALAKDAGEGDVPESAPDEPLEAPVAPAKPAESPRLMELRKAREERREIIAVMSRLRLAVMSQGIDVGMWDYLFQMALDVAGSDAMEMIGQMLEIRMPKETKASVRDFEERIISTLRQQCDTPLAWQSWIMLALVTPQAKRQGLEAEDLSYLVRTYESEPNPCVPAVAAASAPEPAATVVITSTRVDPAALQGYLSAGGAVFHCDKCLTPLLVTAGNVPAVEALSEGEFICSNCDGTTVEGESALFLTPEAQAEYEAAAE